MAVIHLNMSVDEHKTLKEEAASLGMPLATYTKAIVLDHINNVDEPILKKDSYIRKPRTIRNK